jgi:hypothetical protein
MNSNDLVLMGFDDLIPIIFIIIFFVLPIIGRIVESMKGKAKPKPESSEDIKEYLQKMRGQRSRPNQYRAPASKPGGYAIMVEPEQGKEKKKRSREEKAVLEQVGLALQAPRVTQAVTPAAKEETAPFPKPSARARKDGIRTRVMDVPRLSDVQKAMVLKEIFSKPKSLLLKRE